MFADQVPPSSPDFSNTTISWPASKLLIAGFGGLAMAIKSLEAGHEIVVFEKSGELGGTWSANTYPGAECDIPSALYSYSFEPYAEWPNKWSHQPVILDYLRHCADRYGVTPLIRFDTAVTAAHWDGTTWHVTSEHDGRNDEDDVRRRRVGHGPAQPSRASPTSTDSTPSAAPASTRHGRTTTSIWRAGGSPSSATPPAPPSSFPRSHRTQPT